MNSLSSVSFCGSGSESTGSLALRKDPEPCPTCGRVNFRGSGSESTGSLANISNPQEQLATDTVSFKASDSYQKDKGVSALGIVAGLVILGAATVVGLGYAHKSNAFSKMSDGKIKDFLMKGEPAAKKCHEWCSTVKTKSTNAWNKIKDFFSSKKS